MLKTIEREREGTERDSPPSLSNTPGMSRPKRAGMDPLDPLFWRERAVVNFPMSSVEEKGGSNHGEVEEKGGVCTV